jgi:redox-sensitive bicupin YhaK (pirin superfamily)
MSWYPTTEPTCEDARADDVELIIDGRPRDLGGFVVRRLLPTGRRRMVGPFIFFDHMGPSQFAPGQGIDVRPHPHIALATVTYLFEGEIMHRDSLGSALPIRPGDVNWMIAGRGIAHSERTAPELRERGSRLHGIQSWVALPKAQEEIAPVFAHHPKATLPCLARPGVDLRVVLGSAYGATSPVEVLSPTFYVGAELERDAHLAMPQEHEQRATYVVEGELECAAGRIGEGQLVVWKPGSAAFVRATRPSRVMLLGGAPLDGERFIEWNFVASTRERIERAKEDWKGGRFPKIPGDDVEFIPLPGT